MTRQTDVEKLRYLAKTHGNKRHRTCDLCFLVDLVRDQQNAMTRILNSEVRIQK